MKVVPNFSTKSTKNIEKNTKNIEKNTKNIEKNTKNIENQYQIFYFNSLFLIQYFWY